MLWPLLFMMKWGLGVFFSNFLIQLWKQFPEELLYFFLLVDRFLIPPFLPPQVNKSLTPLIIHRSLILQPLQTSIWLQLINTSLSSPLISAKWITSNTICFNSYFLHSIFFHHNGVSALSALCRNSYWWSITTFSIFRDFYFLPVHAPALLVAKVLVNKSILQLTFKK